MPLGVTNLTTSSTTTDATSYATASVSPPANALLLIGFQIGVTSGSPAASVSGLGLTWTLVDKTTTIAGGRTTYIYAAETGGSAPTPGAITISTGGVTANAALWNVTQVTGYDTTTPLGPSVNSRPAVGTSVSVSFGVAPAAGTIRYAVVGVAVAEAPANGAGWTALGTGQTVSNLVNGFRSMYADPSVTNILASWTTSAQANVVGVEVNPSAQVDTSIDIPPAYLAVRGVALTPSVAPDVPPAALRVIGQDVAVTSSSSPDIPAAFLAVLPGDVQPGSSVTIPAAWLSLIGQDVAVTASASPAVPAALLGPVVGRVDPRVDASPAVPAALLAVLGGDVDPQVLSRYQWWDGSEWRQILPRVWDGETWRTDIPVTVIPDDS